MNRPTSRPASAYPAAALPEPFDRCSIGRADHHFRGVVLARRSTWEQAPRRPGPSTGTARLRSCDRSAAHRPPGVQPIRWRAPVLPRKEVIQPQLPLRLPCYDFTPITSPALAGCLQAPVPRPPVSPPASGVASFRGVTGGVYKARERIHRRVLTGGY
jgi:hypothetical protein